MPNSLHSVRFLTLALAISAFAGSIATAQPLPNLKGEGTYTGDLTGRLTASVNSRFGNTSLWVDGVLYGGSRQHPGQGNVIGFDWQFVAGGVTILDDEPFEAGPFVATKESTWDHVMRFEGTITETLASGTWSLTYNPDSSDCRNAANRGQSCETRTGTFSIPLEPVAPPPPVQPIDFGSVCGGGPATALSLFGIVAVGTHRRKRGSVRRK